MGGESASQFLGHFQAKCPGCDYDLRGLMKRGLTTCPECGRSSSLEQILAHNAGVRSSRIATLGWGFAPCGVIIALAAVHRITVAAAPRGSDVSTWTESALYLTATLLFVVGVPWIAVVTVVLIRGLYDDDRWLKTAFGFIIGVLIAFANVALAVVGAGWVLSL
jgi:hypothetical protein